MHLTSMLQWYLFFLDIKEPAGIEYVVKELESNEKNIREVAYESLKMAIESVDQIDKVNPYLEEVALRSDLSATRVKAKVLLKRSLRKKERKLNSIKK